jgi:hypothetical protein
MPRKKSNNYFTSETEQYIVEYNSSTDPVYRAKIFTDHIYFPFYKLAENIIHTFKFYYTDVDELEDLKHEVVTMLLEEKIHRFDPTFGAKAYSYFGTIVKRWLIGYNNANYKKVKRVTNLDNVDEIYEIDSTAAEMNTITISQVVEGWVDESYRNLDKTFDNKQDRSVADAILTVFKKRQDLSVFKKKALYIYIREMTGCHTPTLTAVIGKLKPMFYDYYNKVSKSKVIVEY